MRNIPDNHLMKFDIEKFRLFAAFRPDRSGTTPGTSATVSMTSDQSPRSPQSTQSEPTPLSLWPVSSASTRSLPLGLMMPTSSQQGRPTFGSSQTPDIADFFAWVESPTHDQAYLRKVTHPVSTEELDQALALTTTTGSGEYLAYGQPIGEGAFGTVSVGLTPDNTACAIKAICATEDGDWAEEARAVLAEAAVMLTLGSPMAPTAVLVDEARCTIYLVMPLATMDLYDVAGDSLRPEERVLLARYLTGELAKELARYHARDHVHGDIRANNAMVSGADSTHAAAGDLAVRLIDFGRTRPKPANPHAKASPTIDAATLAPELLAYKSGGLPADIWSLGVMSMILATGVDYFSGNTKESETAAVKYRQWMFAEGLTQDCPPDGVAKLRKLDADLLWRKRPQAGLEPNEELWDELDGIKGHFQGLTERLREVQQIDPAFHATLLAMLRHAPEARPSAGDLADDLQERLSAADQDTAQDLLRRIGATKSKAQAAQVAWLRACHDDRYDF